LLRKLVRSAAARLREVGRHAASQVHATLLLASRVGWVERSDTQHSRARAMGIASLNPSYGLLLTSTRKRAT